MNTCKSACYDHAGSFNFPLPCVLGKEKKRVWVCTKSSLSTQWFVQTVVCAYNSCVDSNLCRQWFAPTAVCADMMHVTSLCCSMFNMFLCLCGGGAVQLRYEPRPLTPLELVTIERRGNLVSSSNPTFNPDEPELPADEVSKRISLLLASQPSHTPWLARPSNCCCGGETS